jgi:hypothetical protein
LQLLYDRVLNAEGKLGEVEEDRLRRALIGAVEAGVLMRPTVEEKQEQEEEDKIWRDKYGATSTASSTLTTGKTTTTTTQETTEKKDEQPKVSSVKTEKDLEADIESLAMAAAQEMQTLPAYTPATETSRLLGDSGESSEAPRKVPPMLGRMESEASAMGDELI